MRKNAITRIIIWSIVLVLLLGILFTFLIGGFRGWHSGLPSFYPGFNYKESSSYSVGAFNLEEPVSNLNVNWLGGSISIESYEGDVIAVTETGALKENEALRWRLRNGTLTIYPRRSFWFFGFGFGATLQKDLMIRIPASWSSLSEISIDSVSAKISLGGLALSELEIDNVSGNIALSGMQADEISIDNVSGSVTLSGISGGILNLDSVSGEIICTDTRLTALDCDTVSGGASFAGSLKRLDLNTASGSVRIESDQMLDEISSDSVSGGVTVVMPDGDGFSAEMDSISGSLNSDFPLTSRGDRRIYGNGGADYSFDSVSGDANLLLKK